MDGGRGGQQNIHPPRSTLLIDGVCFLCGENPNLLLFWSPPSSASLSEPTSAQMHFDTPNPIFNNYFFLFTVNPLHFTPVTSTSRHFHYYSSHFFNVLYFTMLGRCRYRCGYVDVKAGMHGISGYADVAESGYLFFY